MYGLCTYFNEETRRAVLDVGGDEFAVLELIDDAALRIGDLITGALEALGNQFVFLGPGRRTVYVFVRLARASRSKALREAEVSR